MLIPGVSAFFLEPFDDIAERCEIFELRTASVAEKHDDRHAPEALARDAPVRAFLNHFVDALFAPARNPLDVGNLGERFRAQRFLAVDRMTSRTGKRNRIHADEPLLGSPENHRIVATPAMRVAVLVRVLAKQCAAIGKQLYDNGVRCEDVLALVFRQAFRVNAFVIKRRINFETISLAGVEVIGAMTGRGVNDAAALIESDVIGEQAGHLNWQKWM